MSKDGAGDRADRAFAAGVAALAVLALGTGLAHLGLDDVWHDEAASLHFAGLPIETIPGELARRDNHPPLYFLTLRAVQAATGGWEGHAAMIAGRALSVACAAVAVVVTALLGRRAGGRWTGLAAGLVLALCPLHTHYAREIRFYAPAEMLAVVHVLLLVSVLSGEGGPRRWVLPALAGAAAFLSFYLTVAVVAAGLLPVCVAEPRYRRRGLIAVAAAGVLCLPWVPAMVEQWEHFRRFLNWIPERSVWGFLRDLAGQVGSGRVEPGPVAVASAAAFVAMAATGAVRALLRRDVANVAVLAAGGAAVVAVAASALHRPYLLARYALPGVPFLCILAGLGITAVGRGARSRPAIGASRSGLLLAVVLLAPVQSMGIDHREFRRGERWRDAVAWLGTRLSPDDVVAVAPHWDMYPLAFHLPHHDLRIGVDTFGEALAGSPRTARTLWLFADFGGGRPPAEWAGVLAQAETRQKFGKLLLLRFSIEGLAR